MQRLLGQRGAMALAGALAGASLYALAEVLSRDLLAARAALVAAVFAGVFFADLLALAGPLSFRRAVAGAAGVAAVTAVMLGLASLRFDTVDELFGAVLPILAALVLALVPLPFLVAWHGRGWDHYRTLFTESWGIVVRTGAAWLFVGVIWVVILLSDLLLRLVGIDIVLEVALIPPVAMVLTGAGFGLALGVVGDLGDAISPWLVLRLLRTLLPAVLAVILVFVVALPLSGMDAIFGRLSSALTLLTMCCVAATLVTTAVDQGDGEAVAGPVMTTATRVLALILPVPAALGAWAIWLRIAEYGLTPDRLFVAVVAGLGLGYGALYALAVLRGAGWMGRIRQANVWMAVVLLAVSALWLSPALNAEAISARHLEARFLSGAVPADALDVEALDDWGRAGAAVRARLEALAQEPGQEALAARLAAATAGDAPRPPDLEALRKHLAAVMPVQPAGAVAMRDAVLAGLAETELADWAEACEARLESGTPGCVLVVADFWPDVPGDEVLSLRRMPGGWIMTEGLVPREGRLDRFSVGSPGGVLPDGVEGEALIARLQAGPPVLSPVRLNQLGVGAAGLMILP